jgi:hypothetical protein
MRTAKDKNKMPDICFYQFPLVFVSSRGLLGRYTRADRSEGKSN